MMIIFIENESVGSVMAQPFDLCPSCSALVVVSHQSFHRVRFQLITKNWAWFGDFTLSPQGFFLNIRGH